MVYGLPDSGKTYLTSTLLTEPEMCPALHIVFDSSEVTLLPFVNDANLDIVRGDLSVISDVYEMATEDKGFKYKTIIFDNITQLHRTCLENAARNSIKEQLAKGQKVNRSEYIYQQQDYGIARTQVLSVIDKFTEIKYPSLAKLNLVFTAWAVPGTDPTTGVSTVELDLSGKLYSEFAGLFDVVAYLEKKKGVRTLFTTDTPRIPFARNRGNKLPEKMVNPTLPEIRSKLLQN